MHEGRMSEEWPEQLELTNPKFRALATLG